MPGTMDLLASLFKKGDKAEHRDRADEVVVKLQAALNDPSLSGELGAERGRRSGAKNDSARRQREPASARDGHAGRASRSGAP
jgi:hypothetical protein